MARMTNSKGMFKFNSYLQVNKQAVSKDGYTSLYIYVYIGAKGRQELDRIPLGIRWPVDKIDFASNTLIRRQRGDKDANDYNMIILSERAKYNEIAKIYRLSNKRLDLKSFRRELKLNDAKSCVPAYMEHRSKELYIKREISKQTHKNVGSSILALRDYQADVTFSEIDEGWINSYKSWLARVKKLAPNTVWNRIKDLKRYLRLADKETGIFVDPTATSYRNNPTVPKTVYLNNDELSRLMLIYDPLLLTKTQYDVLRAFLFTCFTSLRISDVYKVGRGWLITDSFLQFTAKKNEETNPKTIRVPLVPMAKALIDESLKEFFQLPSEQEYNRTLKELAAKADIRKNLTSHVGRHTFGYLYMTRVGNLFALKEIMGHSSIVTTQRYAHLDDEYDFNQMLKLQSGFEEVAQRGIIRSMPSIS